MDLSRTHNRFGALWIPKEPEQDAPPPQPDRSLDDIDITRYKAELDRRYLAAGRTCDASNLSADQRQYAAGFKNGLREALALLDIAKKPPATVPEKHVEEPHTP